MWKLERRFTAASSWERRGLRDPSDLTDAEWALVAPSIPPAQRGGRKRSVDVREALNAIFHALSTGRQWKAPPKDSPPKDSPPKSAAKSAAHFYFQLWGWDGALERIHGALYVAVREAAGRTTAPVSRSSTRNPPGRRKRGLPD